MKAFVEVTSGIIRGGPKAEKYGDPYDCAVAFSSVDGKTAVGKALVADGVLTAAHIRAAQRACAVLGLKLVWERIKR